MPSLKYRLLIVGIFTTYAVFTAGWAVGFTAGLALLKLFVLIALLPMGKAFVPGNEHTFFTDGHWRCLFGLTLD